MRSNDFGANDECVSVFTLCSCALRALAEFRRVIQLRRVRTRFTSIFNFASVSRLHSGIRVFAVRFSYLVGRWTQLRTNISRSTAHSRPHHIIFRLLCLAIWSRKNVPIASFTKSSSSTAVQTCSHASHTVHVHRARSFFLHRFLFNQSATTMRRQGNSSAEDEEKKNIFHSSQSHLRRQKPFCISFFVHRNCDVNTEGEERQESIPFNHRFDYTTYILNSINFVCNMKSIYSRLMLTLPFR